MFEPRKPVMIRQNATQNRSHDILYSNALADISILYKRHEISEQEYLQYAEYAREQHCEKQGDGRLYYHENIRPQPVVSPAA